MAENIITLDYGSGGLKSSRLITEKILPKLQNPALSQLGDAAVLPVTDQIVVSTDSFVVTPRFFPGGDIGKLCVCGTVNDVCMAGGDPWYLSLSFILEEGLPMEELERIIDSIAKAAEEAGVQIVTGDTKVVEKGTGDGIYINTTGVGVLHTPGLGAWNIKPGDAVIVSGNIGDHGTSVMLARNSNLLQADVVSDCGCLKEPALALGSALGSALRVMRDPTRGGLGTTLNEFIEGTKLGIELQEKDIPVSHSVNMVCELLGLDPLYCACEGRLIAVVAEEKAEQAVQILKGFEISKDACIIGHVCEEHPGKLVLRTPFGGGRIIGKLTGAQLPRIC